MIFLLMVLTITFYGTEINMAKYILENKAVYDSVTHSLFYLGEINTQNTLSIPASLCLLALLENKDEIVSLDQLLSSAWTSRGMNVSTNAIYQNISILRKSLASYGLSEDIIRTIPKRGFVILSGNITGLEIVSETEKNNELNFVEVTPLINEMGARIEKCLKFKKVISFLTVAMICALSFYGTYIITSNNETYGSKYIYPDFIELNQDTDCHVFRNKSVRNDIFFKDFIEYNDLKCSEQKWWYIFNYPPALQTFVLRCSSDLLSERKGDEIICSSDYFN